MRPHREDAPVGTLLSDLSQQVTALLRKELELARTEMSQNVSSAATDAMSMAVGGAIVFGGFLVLLAAAVVALVPVVESLPLAAAIVGGATLLIGGIVVAIAKHKLASEDIAPQKTMRTLHTNPVREQRTARA